MHGLTAKDRSNSVSDRRLGMGRRLPRRGRTFAVAVVAGALLFGIPSVAFGFKEYSGADESSQGVVYTGVSVIRNVLGLDVNSCNVPVYTTQWLNLQASTQSWIEIGTAYDCSSICPGSPSVCRFDYMYLQGDGQSGFVAKSYLPVLGNHTYAISRENANHSLWDATIDGSVLNKISWTHGVGQSVQAGLESHNGTVTVSAHNYASLRYKTGDGSFISWVGEDGMIPSSGPTSPMCGLWNFSTSWRAGENTSC